MQSKYLKTILVVSLILIAGICYSCSKVSTEEFILQDAGETNLQEEQAEQSSCQENYATIWVYVCGEVQFPGVYELAAGSRIFQAVEAAGGMTEEAAEEAVNLANLLSDGQQIQIPSKESASLTAAKEQQSASDGMVHLNSATKEQLMQISGIGESKAEAILQYREEHGSFQSIEELKNVSGIGDSLFSKIQMYVTVE
ncbi:MAG: helix-hairpin-helix domain-containing protein [Lachnospiraceae bacterium]